MSSCAASSCTCCHAASCASATSASSPTGNALRCCRSASGCSQVQPTSLLEPHRVMQITLARPPAGTVPSVAAPCTPWNGSPRLNCCRILHPSPTYVPHETPTPATISPRAPAYIPLLCLIETVAPQNHRNHPLCLPQDHPCCTVYRCNQLTRPVAAATPSIRFSAIR
jgi:hypothetical protein